MFTLPTLNDPDVDTLSCNLSATPLSTLTVSVLFDTGALQGSYVSRRVGAWIRGNAAQEATPQWKMEDSAYLRRSAAASQDSNAEVSVEELWSRGIPSILAVNETPLTCYGTVYADLKCIDQLITIKDPMIFDIKNVRFTVLDIPFDVIVGRPTMAQYKLFSRLEHHFMQMRQTPKQAHNLEEIVALRAFALGTPNASVKSIEELMTFEDVAGMELPEVADAPWDVQPGSEEDPVSLVQIAGSPALQARLKALLRKYSHVLCSSVAPIEADVSPLVLKVDKKEWDSPRNRGPARVQSVQKQRALDAEIAKLLALDVIEPSHASSYSHPHLVPKASVDPTAPPAYRLCIDFRRVNAATQSQERWPLPNIHQALAELGQLKPRFFAKLDMTSGYHQTALATDSRPYTAFITAHGMYQWKRTPMGISGAGSYFQRVLASEVFNGLVNIIMMLYIDDVCVIGRDEDDYMKNLETVFQRMSAKRITLNPRKCHLGLQEVEYVGHVLDATGVTFSPEKIVKVLDFVRPQSQQGLKKFVGLVNYFRTHIKNCSITMAPLNAMLKDYSKRKGLQWTTEADAAFHKLKADLAFCPKLFFDDWESPVVLETDASDKGVGAYLYQRREGEDGQVTQYPVAILSQAFTDQQRRWHTAEKEAYAVFWAITKLRHLLLDRPFLIRTDHMNLTYIDTGTSDKIKRWKLALQEYQFKIEHVEGPKNIVADPLSRLIAVTVLSSPQNPTDEQATTLRLQTQRVATPPVEGVYFLGRGPIDRSIPSHKSESQAAEAAAEEDGTETESHSRDGHRGAGASQPRRRERDSDSHSRDGQKGEGASLPSRRERDELRHFRDDNEGRGASRPLRLPEIDDEDHSRDGSKGRGASRPRRRKRGPLRNSNKRRKTDGVSLQVLSDDEGGTEPSVVPVSYRPAMRATHHISAS